MQPRALRRLSGRNILEANLSLLISMVRCLIRHSSLKLKVTPQKKAREVFTISIEFPQAMPSVIAVATLVPKIEKCPGVVITRAKWSQMASRISIIKVACHRLGACS